MTTTHSPTDDVPVIRLVTESDLQAFRELRLDALRRYPQAFGADYDHSVAQSEAYWLGRLRQGAGGPDGAIYVADTGTELTGMVGVQRQHGAKQCHGATIWGVYVRPAARGRGLADALLTACLAWAESEAIRIVRLRVVTTNASAICLYLRHGFSIYGVEPDAIAHGGTFYDEMLLARRVAALPLVPG